jgi:hypothetical protein
VASNLFDQFDTVSESSSNPFDQFDAPAAPEQSSVARRVGDYGISALKGAIAVPEAAVGIADIVTGGRAGKLAEEAGFRPREAKDILDTYLSPEQKAANKAVGDAEGFLPTLGAVVKNPSTIAHTVTESIPSMLGGGVIARGVSKLAPKVARFVAGAIGEGTIGAGAAAENVRQQTDDGLLGADQVAPVVASGIGTAVFGAAGGRLAQKLGISDVDTMLAQGGSGATQKGIARRIVEGGISEGVFEELPQSIQEQIWQNVALDKPMLEGVPESAAMGLLAGGVMGGVASAAFTNKPGQARQATAQPVTSSVPAGPIGRAAQAASGIVMPQPEGEEDASEQTDTAGLAAGAGGPGVDDGAGSNGSSLLLPGDTEFRGLDADAGAPAPSGERDLPAGTTGELPDAPIATVDTAAQEAATSPANELSEPTDAQKEAGNYKKGGISVGGLSISVENPQGSVRRSRADDPNQWETTINDHYGYIKGVPARAPDKEHVDVYVKPGTVDAFDGDVFVVNQNHPDTGKFDEPKVMIGYSSQDEAEAAYRSNYTPGWNGMGGIAQVPMAQFKQMLQDEKAFLKPIEQQSAAVEEDTNQEPEQASQLAPAAEEPSPEEIESRNAEPEQAAAVDINPEPSNPVASQNTPDNTVKERVDAAVRSAKVIGEAAGKALSALNELGPSGSPELRPIVEVIAKRRAVGEGQLGKNKAYGRVLAAAKDMMNGKPVKLGRLRIDVNELKGDKELHAAGKRLIEIASAPAKEATEARTQTAESYRKRIDEAKTKDELNALASEIQKDESLTDQQAQDLDDAVFERVDSFPDEVRQPEENRYWNDKKYKDTPLSARISFDAFLRNTRNLQGDLQLGTRDGELDEVRLQHLDWIESALEDGKEVPPQVLADHTPDKSKYPLAAALKGGDQKPKPVSKEVKQEKASPTTTEPANKIEDFGDKIGGAKKDLWSNYKDKLDEAIKEDIGAVPLSKSWPEPDYQSLLDNGADQWAVAFMHAARDEIPVKPQKSWKQAQWVKQVELLRDVSYQMMNGEIDTSAARRLLEEAAKTSRGMSDVAGRMELYQLVGHAQSLKGVRIGHGEYSIHNGVEYNPAKSIWTVEKSVRATALSNWPRELATGSTRQEALQNFKEKYASLTIQPEVSKEVSFDIYSKRGEEGFWIGKKVGRNYIDLERFDSVKEARAYKAENNAALVAKLEKSKEIPSVRRDSNNPRVGEDMRGGRDVTPQFFGETFGFKGVEFGNWVEQKKRQQDLNDAFDALMDMAAILDIPPKAISLNGELGLAFGARGGGGVDPAKAHYERDFVVINLTKKEGAGSLGHEWFHALDNYFSRLRGKKSDMMTDALDVSLAARGSDFIANTAVRKEMVQAFGEVMKSIRSTALKARSSKLDAKRSKEYWTTGLEMAARSFETYLIAKLQDQNASNDYLANIVDEQTWKAAESLGWELDDSYPYPTAGEIPAIRAAFDNFFNVIQAKETEQGVALFSRDTNNGMDREVAQLVVDKIKSKWKNAPEVVVVKDMSDSRIRKAVRDENERQLSQGASGQPEGFFDAGKVYLIASELHSARDVQRVLFHEALGHYGLRGVFGNDLNNVLDQVYINRRQDVVAKAKSYGLDVTKQSDRRIAAEEVLAEMAQTNPELNFVKRAIAAIRTWLRAHGFDIEMTDDEIVRELLEPARAFVQRGSEERAGRELLPAFQRVWHGSPHRFDRFSLDAIGSGEGAQAYGWGLYFAGKKEVAEHYRKGISTNKLIEAARDSYNEFSNPDEATQALLENPDLSDRQRELILALQEDSWLGFDYPHQAIAEAIKRPDQWDLSPRARAAVDQQGQLYEVEIPEDDTFLLWDKKMGEQPEAVKSALVNLHSTVIDAWKSNGAWEHITGEVLYRNLSDGLTKGAAAEGKHKMASLKLHDLGVNGIKYLDGSSRSAGGGSYNYVVFDESAAEIVKTNFSRANRKPSKDAGDTFVSAAMEYLSRDPELFQRPSTEVRDIYGIAKELDPGYRVERLGPSMTKEKKADRAWEVFVPGSDVRSGIIMTNAKDVWIDVQHLRSGIDSGSAIYDMAATYAHNNDKVLIGDPNGLSRMAYYRRNENMLSSALKYGTTRHLMPHIAQMNPEGYWTDSADRKFATAVRPLTWVVGDDVNNIREMIYNSWKAAIDNVPELKDVIYDPATQQFQYVDGRPFTEEDSKRIASELSKSSRPYRAGSATQKRAALFNTFLRESGREGRRQLLGTLVDQLRGRGLAPQLKGVMYSRSAVDEGVPSAPPEQASKYADLNRKFREEHITLLDKSKKWLKRQLAPGGLLPKSVFDEKIRRDSEFEVIEFDVKHLVNQLERAIQRDFKLSAGELDTKTQELLSDVMAGKIGEVPDATKVALIGMRQYIDQLSMQYIDGLSEQGKLLMQEAERTGDAKVIAEAQERFDLMQVIMGNVGQYVHRSYRAFDDPDWARAVPDETLDAARDYLIQRNLETMTPAAAAARAEIVLNEILKNGTAYDNMESFIRESKLGAKDLSVLKTRKQIAPQIRALMGEYTDPRINFAKSATKMGRLIWNQKFLEKVLEVGMGNFLFTDDTKPPEATAKIAADKSEVYSPLNGLWTYPETDQAFKDALGKEQMADWFRKVVQINGMVKYGKTVLSPTTAARNWMSAFFFSVANGHFDLRHMKKSVDGLKEYFTHGGDAAKLAYLRELKQLGVVYDTPYAGEMMRLLADTNLSETLLMSKGKLKIKHAADMATKFYQYGDDFWKIIGYENEKRMWMDTGMPEQEAKEKAAERIRNTYPTYSMIGKGVQALRRFPLAGTFVSFPAEIIRTSINMVRYLAEDYKDPVTRPMAIRRAAGMAIASSFAYAAQALSMAALGYDDDDEEAVRQMAAPWQRNSNLLFTGRDGNGNIRFLDMSFLDPYNYWKRPIVAVTRGQPFDEALRDVAAEILTPFFGVDILAGTIFEVLANKKESGAPVYQGHDDAINQVTDIANHMRKTIQPGIVSNVERTYKALDGEVSFSGRKYDINDEAAAWVGFRVSTLDPKVALYYRSFDFKDAKAEADKSLREVIRNPKGVDSEDLREAYDMTNKLRERAYQQMSQLVQAGQRSGMTNQQVFQTLKNSGISNQDIFYIRTGMTPRYKVNPQSMREQIMKARGTFGPEVAQEIRKRYAEVAGYQ